MTAHPLRDLLEVRRLPLCPEIELALLADGADLDVPARGVTTQGRAPYFGFCWASGQALARFILDAPELVRGARVADFGSGCGVVAIAAALAGAVQVVACDEDPDARDAIERNATTNRVRVRVNDTLDLGAGGFDVLLAADVCYDERNRDLIRGRARAGATGLVCDPGRWALPRESLELLATLEAETLPALEGDPDRVHVFRLTQPSSRTRLRGSERPIVWRSSPAIRSGSSSRAKSGSSG